MVSLAEYWLRHLTRVVGVIPFVVVGNKIDLAAHRRREQENLDDLCATLDVDGLLGSAKTGENVEASFLLLARKVMAEAEAHAVANDRLVDDAASGLIAVTDQIVMDFCGVMGGQEAAMPIVRQQLGRAGVDVKAPTVEGLRLAVEYLAETEASFRNAEDVEASKLKRLGWVKELT